MIKKFDEFNEGIGNWVRSKFNSDEKTADGILNKVSSLSKSDIKTDEFIEDEATIDTVLNTYYYFTIDGFNIKSSNCWALNGREYFIHVDEVELKASQYLAKKIFKAVHKIYYVKPDTSNEDFVRRDAKIHFSKR